MKDAIFVIGTVCSHDNHMGALLRESTSGNTLATVDGNNMADELDVVDIEGDEYDASVG